MQENKVRWNEEAKKQYAIIIDYILQDSVQNAINVNKKLHNVIEAISKFPEKYPLDKYKTHNDGSFRAFTLFHYRVSYRIKNNIIRILRIRHTSMKPKYY